MEKKLYRSKKNKKVAGVCAGVAEYINVDVTIIRLAWAIGSLLSVFLGVIAYFVCALIIPEKPDDYEVVD